MTSYKSFKDYMKCYQRNKNKNWHLDLEEQRNSVNSRQFQKMQMKTMNMIQKVTTNSLKIKRLDYRDNQMSFERY